MPYTNSDMKRAFLRIFAGRLTPYATRNQQTKTAAFDEWAMEATDKLRVELVDDCKRLLLNSTSLNQHELPSMFIRKIDKIFEKCELQFDERYHARKLVTEYTPVVRELVERTSAMGGFPTREEYYEVLRDDDAFKIEYYPALILPEHRRDPAIYDSNQCNSCGRSHGRRCPATHKSCLFCGVEGLISTQITVDIHKMIVGTPHTFNVVFAMEIDWRSSRNYILELLGGNIGRIENRPIIYI